MCQHCVSYIVLCVLIKLLVRRVCVVGEWVTDKVEVIDKTGVILERAAGDSIG